MRTKKKKPIDWLFPEVRKKVLALLLSDPAQRWYLRDIERRTSLAIGTVRRELTGLTNAEIINKSKDGNRTYYQANTGCPFFPELSGLLRKTAGLVDVLSKAFKTLSKSKKIKVAFVYGSFAADSAKVSSDVDLMVIGSSGFGQVVDAIGAAQKHLGREINPTVYPINEWRKKMAQKHHFVTSVSKSSKIFIVGTADDLERITD
jgi:predicted nucleotidyltransferase